jgi:hypothetical protein
MTNIHRAIFVGRQLVLDGLAPYVPHFDAYMFAHGDGDSGNTHVVSWNAYLEWDLEWVAQSEAMLVLAGKSKGAKLEAKIAKSLGIPVFYEVDGGYHELLRFAADQGLTGVRR